MRISDIINEDCVEIGAEFCDRDEALTRLLRLHQQQGNIQDSTALRRELLRQEKSNPGAVSCRVAIPVIRDAAAHRTRLTAITLSDGVEYSAPDGRKVNLIFLITGSQDNNDWQWLKARLMRLLMDAGFTARLSAAKSREEFIRMLKDREQVRFTPPVPQKGYDCSKFLMKNNKAENDSFLHRIEKNLPEFNAIPSFIMGLPHRLKAAYHNSQRKKQRHPS